MRAPSLHEFDHWPKGNLRISWCFRSGLYISSATKTDWSIFTVVSNFIVVLKDYVVLAPYDKPFFPYLLSLALLEELSSCQMQHCKKIIVNMIYQLINPL